jgi:hypothetical protein
VAQMNLGIIMSYFNAKFFGDNINIWWAIYFIPACNALFQILCYSMPLWNNSIMMVLSYCSFMNVQV